jgi:hypothetical protein
MEKRMDSHSVKVALSALGMIAMLTTLTFAQKPQHLSHVDQSGLFEVLRAAGASGGQLPRYEVMGFPISALQMSVLKSGGIEEQSLTPMLTLQGMPASPHQIAVIGFRTKQHARAEIGGRAIFDLSPQ